MSRKTVGPYDVGRVIGRGTVGDVREAIHRPTGKKMAMKVIDRTAMVDPTLGERLRREIAIMKLLDHPHVVSAKEVLRNSTHVFIAMELVAGGELFTEITQKGRLTETEARKYMSQLVDGLTYCHGLNVVHRNLKPENLLLDKDKNLKITDFGVANFLTSGRAAGAAFLETKVGSHDYVAPEVLTQERYRGQPADVWSCGVILYAMLAGALPFEAQNTKRVFEKICSADFYCPDDIFSDDAQDLLHKILVPDPEKRIKMEDILAEPWFKGQKKIERAAVKVDDAQVEKAFVAVDDTAAAGTAAASPAKPAPKKKNHGPVRGTMRDYNILDLLGKGAFSQVFRCVHRPTDKEFAMKVIAKDVLQKKNMSTSMGREIAIMKMLDHPHVVVMREALGSSVELFLVLDLVPGGSLKEALGKDGKFTEERSKNYMYQLFDGLSYCHSRGVCHRDLKPENLMLDENDNIKIADFGLGNFVNNEDLLFTRCGTPHYVAPEIIDGQKGYVGKIADIWSCGVILYRMMAGRVPFRESSTHMLYSKIRAADYYMPSSFSDGVQDMLQSLLVPHPPKRITIEKAMEQPWFDKLRKKSTSSASEYLEEAMAPSDHSIAMAIKPVLRQGSFQMRSPHGHGGASSFKPKSAKPTNPKPAAAAAAAPAASSVTILAEHMKIQTKKHKLGMYRTDYKEANVCLNSKTLNIAVNNKEVNEFPFPLKIDGDFQVTENKTGFVIKLPRAVLPHPKYYKFTWNSKSESDHSAAEKLCKQLMKHGAPSLDKPS